jgi:hypothetical protein
MPRHLPTDLQRERKRVETSDLICFDPPQYHADNGHYVKFARDGVRGTLPVPRMSPLL